MFTEITNDILGYLGGGILAVCLLPQLVLIVQTKSVQDISYAWTLLYFSGLALTFVYLVAVGAIAAWAPMTLEMAGVVAIICFKAYYSKSGQQVAPGPSTDAAGVTDEADPAYWADAAEKGQATRSSIQSPTSISPGNMRRGGLQRSLTKLGHPALSFRFRISGGVQEGGEMVVEDGEADGGP